MGNTKVTKSGKGISAVVLMSMLMIAQPAFAQIDKVNTTMTMIQNVLVGVSLIFFTIALMWAGFKMAFQHAKWSEISNIVIGGILVGGAAAIAALLVSP